MGPISPITEGDQDKAAGFTRMAQDYLTRSDIREATVRAMTKNIRREFGAAKADAFARLAELADG